MFQTANGKAEGMADSDIWFKVVILVIPRRDYCGDFAGSFKVPFRMSGTMDQWFDGSSMRGRISRHVCKSDLTEYSVFYESQHLHPWREGLESWIPRGYVLVTEYRCYCSLSSKSKSTSLSLKHAKISHYFRLSTIYRVRHILSPRGYI